MQELTDILRTITDEMQKALSAQNAVGDPVTVEGKTVIPLMSVGMGFGAGSSSGKADNPGGGGGAIGMKPVAVIIIDQGGVRVERMNEPQHTLIEHMAEAVPKLMEGLTRKKETHVQIKSDEDRS